MKVSVITPFYDGNDYIHDYEEMLAANERALADGDELEVLIINDSPKISVGLLGIYASRPNWRVIPNERNVGIHASRIHGYAEATGDYILFLDQDDRLAPDAVAKLLTKAKELTDEGQGVCYRVIVANAALEQADGTKPLWYRTAYHKGRIDQLRTYTAIGTQIISPGQCMMAKEIIPREWLTQVVTVNGADDYFLWLLLLDKGIGFSYLDEALYEHRYTARNLSADTTVTDASTEQFLGYLERAGFQEKELAVLRRQLTYKAAFRAGDLWRKVVLSVQNLDLFLANAYFKLRTHTGYGFNR